MSIVEPEQNVGERQSVGVGIERLTGLADDRPFLTGTILDAVKDNLVIDEVVVQTVKIVPEPCDQVVGQPRVVLARGWPVPVVFFVILAQPLSQPFKGQAGRRWWGAGGGPHLAKVERKQPGLGAVDALLHLQTGTLQQESGVGVDERPFGNGLETHVQHAGAVDECFPIAVPPLDVGSFAEGEQRGRPRRIVAHVVELVTLEKIGDQSDLVDVVAQVVGVHADSFKHRHQGVVQRGPDQGGRVVQHRKEIAGGHVPVHAFHARLGTRPGNVELVSNAVRVDGRGWFAVGSQRTAGRGISHFGGGTMEVHEFERARRRIRSVRRRHIARTEAWPSLRDRRVVQLVDQRRRPRFVDGGGADTERWRRLHPETAHVHVDQSIPAVVPEFGVLCPIISTHGSGPGVSPDRLRSPGFSTPAAVVSPPLQISSSPGTPTAADVWIVGWERWVK